MGSRLFSKELQILNIQAPWAIASSLSLIAVKIDLLAANHVIVIPGLAWTNNNGHVGFFSALSVSLAFRTHVYFFVCYSEGKVGQISFQNTLIIIAIIITRRRGLIVKKHIQV